MFNIKPADRWVGEVEHFFQMVENHKKVPYRGVFGVKPRDPEARIDPPSAEKVRALTNKLICRVIIQLGIISFISY
jgi:hypothetical protein